MKNTSHRKKWNAEAVEQHVEPHPITIIKGKRDDKSDKDFVKLKFQRDPTSEKSDLYEFKMALFENVNPEAFCCLFVTST